MPANSGSSKKSIDNRSINTSTTQRNAPLPNQSINPARILSVRITWSTTFSCSKAGIPLVVAFAANGSIAIKTYTSGSVNTNANVVMPIVSPLRSFLLGKRNATFENSIIPQLIVSITTMYFARTLSILLNAVKNAILSGLDISCIALSKNNMPRIMIATDKPSKENKIFSVFEIFCTIAPPEYYKNSII